MTRSVTNYSERNFPIRASHRSDPNNPYHDWFVFSACHGHYHIRDFSVYQLFNLDGTLAAVGHKQGFCFEDSFKYAGGKSNGYFCGYQGITSGWETGITNNSRASGLTLPEFQKAITLCA